MEYIIRFGVNLFDLGIFWYYLHSFKKMKRVPKIVFVIYILAGAAVWSAINSLNIPFLNLFTLICLLAVTTLFFDAKLWSRIVNIIIFVGTGMVIEPIGLILLKGMKLLSNLLSKRNVRLSKVPREIAGVLVMIFGFSILNCCFVIMLSMESGNSRSMVMCIIIIISIILTYYFMLYMMERFGYLSRKRHEDEMYRKEMYYKEIYYTEVERRNEYVQNLKHDIKNRLIELHYLLEKRDIEALQEHISLYDEELTRIDESRYSDNPIVDSVLRTKIGAAKVEGIQINTSIRIPKQMQLEHGDIGVLYGNLLDNAIEACRKVEIERRFIKIENKFTAGKMLLIIENSKTGEKNESLTTTKSDNYSHGRGIHSVRRVVEKYSGTITFTDKGEVFEVSAMLYGIEAKE